MPVFPTRKLHQIPVFILITALLPAAILAQPKENSPYSQYGLGDPLPQYFAHQAGIGGQTIAYHDLHQLNPYNPASMAFLKTASFETGMFANVSHYESDQGELNNWSGNLAYLALGFTLKSPINEALDKVQTPWRFGMGFSLLPYSVVGYNVINEVDQPDVGIVNNRFEGDGGTYRFVWSNAARYKQTSFGVNLGWAFGRTEYKNTTQFVDSVFTNFQNNFRTDARVNGFIWKIGVQHDHVLQYAENNSGQPVRWVTFGLTANTNMPLSIQSDRLQLRSRGEFTSGVFINPDTLLYEEGAKRDLTLPAAFGVGVDLVRLNKYRLGMQYEFEHWNDYKNDLRPEVLRSTHAVSLGAEYIADHASYNNYFKKVRLRGGLYFRQDPRVVEGKQLTDFGASIGFGFPLTLPRLQTSYMNTAFEFGYLGANALITEAYGRFTVGFCLNDNTWFYKRRFE